MTFPPETSPLPVPIFMSQPPAPTSSATPIRPAKANRKGKPEPEKDSAPKPDPTFRLPKLRLEVRDLAHAGARVFLSSVVPTTAIEFAIKRVLELLYISPTCPQTNVPGTRSVTLIIRSMPGVAYTTGTDLDSDHKEIHFSAEYIEGIDKVRKSDEILGVLTHEMVHCYQYNAHGTCPGGLIEGIADWVRLNSGLSPPHWKREATGKWDAGYQHTGYFLDYLEHRFGDGTVSRMNEKLRTSHYKEKPFWTELLGRPVEQLWGDYVEAVEAEMTSENPRKSADGVGSEDDELVLIERQDTEKSLASPKPTPTSSGSKTSVKDCSARSDTPAGVV